MAINFEVNVLEVNVFEVHIIDVSASEVCIPFISLPIPVYLSMTSGFSRHFLLASAAGQLHADDRKPPPGAICEGALPEMATFRPIE